MKKIVIMLLVATLLLGVLPMSASLADTNYATVYSGNKYGVRLRLGPATTYASELIVPSGTTVTVLETGTVWTRIQAGTTTGYMMSKFLLAAGTSSGIKVESTATVYAGNGLRTWLRTAANGKRLGLYSDGTAVSVLSYGAEWSRVMIGSSVGYMMTKYLSFPTVTPTPVPTLIPVTSASLNYPYPLVGDTLKPILPDGFTNYTCKWELMSSDGTTVESTLSNALVYTVTSAALGRKIKLTVTGTGEYTDKVFVLYSQPVTNSKTITGVMIVNKNNEHTEPVVGDVLKSVIAPSSAVVTYSWRVAGTEKGTESEYTVLAADEGKTIQVRVTATAAGGFTGSATSNATSKVVGTASISAVKLSTPYPVVGTVLSAVTVPADAKVNSYVWYVDGVQMGTGSTYTATAYDLGKKITVKVTSTTSKTYTSDPSSPVAKTLLSSVTLNNTSPSVDEKITATVLPKAAVDLNAVTYQWYADDTEIAGATGQTYTVEAACEGKSLYVKATGASTYGGVVTSAKTTAVSLFTPLVSVSLDNTTPVLGDTITATLTPSSANPTTDASSVLKPQTYIWTVGGKSFVQTDTNGNKFKITDANWVGTGVQVQVNGVAPFAGTVKSGTTSAIVDARALTGVDIYNTSNYTYATAAVPMAGQTLKAYVYPAQAMDNSGIVYSWTCGGHSGTGREYTIPEGTAAGTTVTVSISFTNGAYTYTATTGTRTTLAIPSTVAIPAVKLGSLTPVTGERAVNSVSGSFSYNNNTYTYSGSVSWSPALNRYDQFEPSMDYTATVSIAPPSGFSVSKTGTAITSGGTNTLIGNVIKVVYPTTGAAPVSDLSISGINAPVIGEQPDTAADASTQYAISAVKWADDAGNAVPATGFEAGKVYKATVILTANSGFNFDGFTVGSAAFTVSGARTTSLSNVTTSQATVTATYDTTSTDVKVVVSADRTTVPVGSSTKQVVCSAYLTNYASTAQATLPWVWAVNGANDATTTKISADGILTVSKAEPTGQTLVVTATVTLSGKSYSSSVNITTTAEAADSSDVSVVFIAAPSSVKQGGKATFAARVDGAANETVNWSIDSKLSNIFTDGTLIVSDKETADTIIVTATSMAYPDKSSSVGITVAAVQTEPITVNFTKEYTTLEPSATAYTFTAEATGTGVAKPTDVEFTAGGEMQGITCVNKKDGSCDITVGDTAIEGATVWVVASYTGSSDEKIIDYTSFKVQRSTISNTVSVTPTAANLVAGSTMTLTATTIDKETVTWSSADTNIATVDPTSGMVTGVAAGTVKITATSATGSASATITVKAFVVAVVLDAKTLGYEDTTNAYVANWDKTKTPAVAWSSSNTSVADIDGDGKITAKSASGTTSITGAISGIGSASAELTVTAPDITLTAPDSLGLTKTGTASVAVGNYSHDWTVAYASDDAAAITCDSSTGALVAVGSGEATITATVSNKASVVIGTASKKVRVDTPIITLNVPSGMNLGGTGTITATWSPADYTEPITIKPSGTSITMSGNTLTAVAVGSTSFTAEGKVGSVTITTSPESITISEPTLSLSVSTDTIYLDGSPASLTMTADLQGYDGDRTIVFGKTSGTGDVNVSGNTATAAAAGKVQLTVTATGTGLSKTVSKEITVAIPSVKITSATATVTAGDEVTMTADVNGFSTEASYQWTVIGAATLKSVSADKKTAVILTNNTSASASVSLTVDTVTSAASTITVNP